MSQLLLMHECLQDILGRLRQLSVPDLLSRIKSLEEVLAQEAERRVAVEQSYRDEVAGLHAQLREQRDNSLREREEMKTSHAAEKKKLNQQLKGMWYRTSLMLIATDEHADVGTMLL
jgi:hypothetical protein